MRNGFFNANFNGLFPQQKKNFFTCTFQHLINERKFLFVAFNQFFKMQNVCLFNKIAADEMR